MTYKYFTKSGEELYFNNFIEAVRDLRVYIVETINSIDKVKYYRSGAGWYRLEGKQKDLLRS